MTFLGQIQTVKLTPVCKITPRFLTQGSLNGYQVILSNKVSAYAYKSSSVLLGKQPQEAPREELSRM